VAWSPDGTRLASAGDDETVRIWNPTSGKQTRKLTGHVDEVTGVGWAPDSAHLASADASGLVIVWNRAGEPVTSLAIQPSQCLAWSAPLLAVGQPGQPAILTLRNPADLA
jgi:WD40 repeat protein